MHSDSSERIAAAIRSLGSSVDACLAQVGSLTEQPDTHGALAALKTSMTAAGVDLGDGAFEGFLLTWAAARSLDRLDDMPLAPQVKLLCRQSFARFADPQRRYDLADNSFVAYCKLASLRRFPAGQFDWEPSGLPRSWVPRIRPLSTLYATMKLVTFGMHGFGPTFFVHMGTGGRNYALLEHEANRSYYRMAQSLELQPHMHGVIAASWLHSPDTFAISPHLAWLNRVFLENGAIVGTVGVAAPDCGVLHRSPERRRAFESGTWTPTVGLVIWPRDQVLEWARQHPELES